MIKIINLLPAKILIFYTEKRKPEAKTSNLICLEQAI